MKVASALQLWHQSRQWSRIATQTTFDVRLSHISMLVFLKVASALQLWQQVRQWSKIAPQCHARTHARHSLCWSDFFPCASSSGVMQSNTRSSTQSQGQRSRALWWALLHDVHVIQGTDALARSDFSADEISRQMWAVPLSFLPHTKQNNRNTRITGSNQLLYLDFRILSSGSGVLFFSPYCG